MAVFGYFIWVVLCSLVSMWTLGLYVISQAFDNTSGAGKVVLLFLVVNILMWYGAYCGFPFTVIFKQD